MLTYVGHMQLLGQQIFVANHFHHFFFSTVHIYVRRSFDFINRLLCFSYEAVQGQDRVSSQWFVSDRTESIKSSSEYLLPGGAGAEVGDEVLAAAKRKN